MLLYMVAHSIQGYWGVSRCTDLKMASNSKTTGRTVKQFEPWDSVDNCSTLTLCGEALTLYF